MRPQPTFRPTTGGPPGPSKPGTAWADGPVVMFSRRTYLKITLAISLCFGLVLLPGGLLQRSHTTQQQAILLLLNPILAFGQVFALNYLLRYSRNPLQRWLSRQPPRTNWRVRLVLNLLGSSCYFVGRYYLDKALGFQLDNNPPIALLGVVVIVTIVGISFQVAIEMVENSRRLTLENEALKREQLVARYESLKQQLSPHFLFNSLTTLSDLVYDEPAAAARFVEEMAQVYRYLLQYGELAAVPLRTEISFLRSYYYLLQMRFGEGLALIIDLPADIQEQLVPPLALQLLLENAVKHNKVSRHQPLVVRVDFVPPATIRVHNSRSPLLVPEPSSGIGLSNLTNRVLLLTQQPLLIEQTITDFSVYLPLPA